MSGSGMYEWMALRRVHDGGVAKSAGAYIDHGRPITEHLTGVFDRLIWMGLVSVAGGDPIWELRSLSLTDTGQARYMALGEHQRGDPQAPGPEHATTESRAGHRSSTGLPAPPSDQPDLTLPSPTDRKDPYGS